VSRLRRRARAASGTLAWSTLLLVLAPSSAYAYVDPGMGSLWLQAIASIIVGGLLTGRERLSALWRHLTQRKPKSGEPPPPDPE